MSVDKPGCRKALRMGLHACKPIISLELQMTLKFNDGDNNMITILFPGGGRRPETWDTIIECLKIAELNYLADSVEMLLDDELPHVSPTPQQTNAG